MKAENWNPISGFPNYEVSDCGSVRNKTNGRILSLFARDEYGHRAVTLCNRGTRRDKYVHRLVLNAFVGECQKLDEQP